MKTALLSLAMAAAAVAPGAASAATISVNATTGTIQYKAAAGEANRLALVNPVAFTFADHGAPLTAGAGCTANPDLSVFCPAATVVANLGDQDDAARVNSFASLVPVTINGGDGDDDFLAGAEGHANGNGNGGDDTILVASNTTGIAVGGNGNDAVGGVSSSNTLYGSGGNDLLAVQSSFSPDTLSGDAGADRLVGGRSDGLFGGDGNDLIIGGTDGTLSGGNNADQILSRGGATIDAGPGNDQVDATDPGVDTIVCGTGADKVWAGPEDTVDADCEKVFAAPAPGFAGTAQALADAAALLAHSPAV
jgi:Ca2+-binding RTX toxin-like protein